MLREPPLPRGEFPVFRRWHYLNHAAVAALPEPAARAMAAWARRAAEQGAFVTDEDDERAEVVRAEAASLLGVAPAEVAFVKNTTEGLGFVAHGLTWRPGDRVVVPQREFPSTFYPWAALRDLGVTVSTVAPTGPGWALEPGAFADVLAAGPPPKVVALSWVQFARGWRSDLAALAELAHEAGALLCVDAIQGLGVVPADLRRWGVDFATADARKWLLGPAGIGVLYVAEGVLDRLRPLEVGWASVAHRQSLDDLRLVYDPTARRLEGGSANMAGIAALGASLDLLQAAGPETIWAYVDELASELCSALEAEGAVVLSDRGPGRSGIVSFEVPGQDPAEVVARAEAASVALSARGQAVRASVHACNDRQDLDALIEVVRGLVKA